MVKKSKHNRFRDNRGRFTSEYTFSQLWKRNLVTGKYSNGKRIRIKKSKFINDATKNYEIRRDEKRKASVRKRIKVQKITGKKITKSEKPPEDVTVGPRGGLKRTQPFERPVETYVRFGFATRRVSGSDGPAGRGAALIPGKVSFRDALKLTRPDSFFYIWEDLGIRDMIESNELTLLPDSGVHYFLQYADQYGFKYMVPGSEIRYDGYAMLNI